MTTLGIPFLLFLAMQAGFLPRAGAQNAALTGTPGPAYVRENYTKFEYRVPMRDGVKLFTSVYVPKDVFTDNRTYPIMMTRTPYTVRLYGADQYREGLGPSDFFAREKFIFVYQDVRGRYMSEGEFVNIRPHKPVKSGPQDTDESTDTYDTIDWLVKHVPGNAGKVGMWGISQPGFYASAGMIDAHPALVVVSPQAPVTDYYLGDDNFHNGAFMLAANFGFYMGFVPRSGEPGPPPPALPFAYGTPDGYEFFLAMGSLANADEKYFQHKNPYWIQNIEHTAYDELWQSRSIWKHLKGVKPAVMVVGGWFDAEDLQGPLRTFEFMEKNSPPAVNMLVMGPWTHGGFARGDGDQVGNVHFGAKTGLYFRERIEFPFFLYHLKGKGDGQFPKAWVFETGVNQWRRFDAWPPGTAAPKTLFLDGQGKLSWQQPASQSFGEYISDPAKPVPYLSRVVLGMRPDYMTDDQRFAASRTDVLVFRTPPLEGDVAVFGPVAVDLKVSTTGTDADFVVKLIDVYPGDYPDYGGPAGLAGQAGQAGQAGAAANANAVPMGGYQQLVRGEPFRGKFRRGFEKPVAFEPGKPDHIAFRMPDVAHTFRPGHRIMVQVQSSWFPLTDRNPQKFLEIPKALAGDFVKATQRVYFGGADGSRIQISIAGQK
ncbi:MAG TPA: CocE/NonD family hydrolase [Candidatus Acidoferrales bacterium]|jgi:putative CocE/NonD family hydrolase|nr:CocE/NonD family hydrolase [Candidatus Acidoferrales bacterium]